MLLMILNVIEKQIIMTKVSKYSTSCKNKLLMTKQGCMPGA